MSRCAGGVQQSIFCLCTTPRVAFGCADRPHLTHTNILDSLNNLFFLKEKKKTSSLFALPLSGRRGQPACQPLLHATYTASHQERPSGCCQSLGLGPSTVQPVTTEEGFATPRHSVRRCPFFLFLSFFSFFFASCSFISCFTFHVHVFYLF